MKEIKINFDLIISIILLILLFSFSYWTRIGTMKSKVILDYDPWYQYRMAKNILENNLKTPKWDLLTFFPPGRTFERYVGWEYTMIFFYKILSIFNPSLTFMEAAKLSPVLMVGFSSIAAFFLGKLLTNKWGGLTTGIFAAATPTFIGVSMAGYCDTDAVVVFYSFICIYFIFLALKKKKIWYYTIALVANIIFIYNWFFGWYISFFFSLFIFALIGYKLLENLIYNKKLDLLETWGDVKHIVVPLVLFILVLNIFGFILKLGNTLVFAMLGLGFTGGSGGGIVNVAGRVGTGPILLFLIGLPLLTIYKIYKKQKISPVEIFLFMWSVLTFYLILHGVRFSLMFSCAVSAAAGYVVGNLTKF